MADVGNEANLKIIKKFCLADGGCPKLKKCNTYSERVQVCSQCRDIVFKWDMVEILRELYANQDTSQPKPPAPPKTGKGTELSTPKIKLILDYYYNQGMSVNDIRKELHLQHLTVKNVIYEGFKNESSNEKVRKIKEEMNVPK